jgi:hypothetical protein
MPLAINSRRPRFGAQQLHVANSRCFDDLSMVSSLHVGSAADPSAATFALHPAAVKGRRGRTRMDQKGLTAARALGL